jgi:hypothetical protein
MTPSKSTSPRARKRLYWHPDAHQKLTGSRLYFWFFAFATNYPRDEVVAALRDVAREMGVSSFATYELIGSFDLLARFYMRPERCTEFEEAYAKALEPFERSNSQPFRVQDIPRNWVWAGGPSKVGASKRPDKEALEQHYSRAQIELLNEEDNTSRERFALIRRFSDLGLVTRQPGDEGIKFVTTIGASHRPDDETRARLRHRLESTLDKLSPMIRERSLYEGEFGQRELFLVMCRIKQNHFQRVRRELLEPLGQAGAVADARLTTYPVVSDDFICFQDRLAAPAVDHPDVTALLQGHETGQFEVKGSLATPIDDWLRDGKPIEDLGEKSSLTKSVLKAVVALLNSGGGTVAVGALEEQAYGDAPDALERMQELPLVGSYRVLGLVDKLYRQKGWDNWDRKLRSLIRDKIDPNPGVLVETREIEVGGRKICAINVDDPGDEGEFFLRVSKNASHYFGREGTQVHQMSGSEAKRHRDQVRRRRSNARNRN